MSSIQRQILDLNENHLAGVRTRRIFALLLDLIFIGFVSLVTFVMVIFLGLFTFGLPWLLIPALLPIVAFFYNGLTVSGARMATWGMGIMDIEMRMMDGGRVPFLNAAFHALLFYFSWTFLSPLILLISLLTRDKRCLHDILAGVIVIRCSHWRPESYT